MSDNFLSSAPEDLSNKRIPILVVDDSRDNLDLMEALLVSEGFEKVHLASSGPEALSLLAGHSDVGLVLLDMMMPGMDGYEVCRRIFANETWRRIPVIIVTGGALRRNEALEKSFAAGAMDFITKPINEVELLTRIGSALTLYRERVIRLHKTRELEESETKFRVTFDQAPVGIAHVDLHGKFLMVNQRLCDMLGYARADFSRLAFEDLCVPTNGASHQGCLRGLVGTEATFHTAEVSLVDRQDRIVWTQLTVSPLREPSGKPKYFIYVIEDISERKHAEDSLRLAATVFDSSTEAIIITDARANIMRVNRAFTEITGHTEGQVVGKNPRLLSSGIHDEAFYSAMWSTLNTTGQWQGEISNRRKSGEVYPSWLSISAVKDEKGEVINYVGVGADITTRKIAEERLSFLANHDPLTELPNRILLGDRLQHAIDWANRENLTMALLFVDLDRFKNINDTLGHDMGDLLLQGVGQRFSDNIRKCDTLARWGGDEFILLLETIRSDQDAALVARRILALLEEPFKLMGYEIVVTASIGISLFPRDGRDAQTLLKNADAAMYTVKEKGRNGFRFFTSEMNAAALERFQTESDLRRALGHDELILYYQPQLEIATGNIVGVEALLRWRHPRRGLVLPHHFVPLAEETGLIAPIGEWAIRTACAQNRRWQEAGLGTLRMAVNLSRVQLNNPHLAKTVRRILHETNLQPELLEIEVTETLMMQDLPRGISILKGLAALGVHITMDDFGTGYSSLCNLRNLPIGAIKLHRSLIHDLPSATDDIAIARALISLAHNLRLKVVAEGVEREEQLTFLSEEGCDMVQGYFFCKPVSAADLEAMLSQGFFTRGLEKLEGQYAFK
jgi:diguanylate cyclase (GGDEF)-like protein/PAS domain S-box-containing protein